MEKLLLLFITLALTTISAAQEPWEDINPDYGYSESDPIFVGGEDLKQGPVYERAYLDQLTGSAGEKISYRRTGSCCEFETPNGLMGGGLLDIYEITHDGLEEPVSLYLNMYDPHEGELKIPEGFKLKE